MAFCRGVASWLPSVAVRYGRSDAQVANLSGVDWSVLTEYTRFQSIPALTKQTNGDRALTVAEISRRFQAALLLESGSSMREATMSWRA